MTLKPFGLLRIILRIQNSILKFISGIQGWFNIPKKINASHHIIISLLAGLATTGHCFNSFSALAFIYQCACLHACSLLTHTLSNLYTVISEDKGGKNHWSYELSACNGVVLRIFSQFPKPSENSKRFNKVHFKEQQ